MNSLTAIYNFLYKKLVCKIRKPLQRYPAKSCSEIFLKIQRTVFCFEGPVNLYTEAYDFIKKEALAKMLEL